MVGPSEGTPILALSPADLVAGSSAREIQSWQSMVSMSMVFVSLYLQTLGYLQFQSHKCDLAILITVTKNVTVYHYLLWGYHPRIGVWDKLIVFRVVFILVLLSGQLGTITGWH